MGEGGSAYITIGKDGGGMGWLRADQHEQPASVVGPGKLGDQSSGEIEMGWRWRSKGHLEAIQGPR